MPRLNTRGAVVSGLGLLWLTDDLIIGQRQQPTGAWAVCTAPSLAGPWTPIEPRGCNFLAAGGNNWAAFGGGIFGPAAIPGAAIPAGLDGRGAAAPDGTVLLVADPQRGGLILKRLDGSTYEDPSAWPTDRACVIDRQRALWADARGGVRTCGDLPVPQHFDVLPWAAFAASVFYAQRTWWMAYHSTDAIGYICRPFDSTEGYRICLPPAFYPNAVALSETLARFVWSLNSAESADAIRTHDQDLTAPRVSLVPVPQPEPPDPEPPDPPDPQPEPPDPVPPDPPHPEPPDPPKGLLMIYLDKGHTNGEAYCCEEVARGDGLIALRDVTDGHFLSCNPDTGELLKQTTSDGPWEGFKKGRSTIISDMEWNGRKCHTYPYDEA